MPARVSNIVLQRPLPHQQPVLDDPRRFKVLRWGRRAGKTRIMHVAAAVGHGNRELDEKQEREAAAGAPRVRCWWPGMLTGGKVCWISRDNPQMDLVWSQEMRPRYRSRPGIVWREQDMVIEMKDNSGSIDMRSNENIDSARGFDFDLLLIDEAGHWNLDVAWNSVLRSTLVDRRGSALIASTTRRGSYFNQLCERIQAGELTNTSWTEFYATAFDNPRLDPEEIRALIAEFPDGSLDLEQEVWAKLVTGGGIAFKEWNEKVHVARMEPPPGWSAAACMDWGYSSHGWFGLAFCGPDKEVFFRWESYFKETPPHELGFQIGNALQRWELPAFIVAGDDMWYTTQGPVTIAEKFAEGLRAALGAFAPALVQSPKGPGSRVTRKILMHEALRWTANPEDPAKLPPQWFMPRLRFHPDCYNALRTIPKLGLDQKEMDKVDTDGEDHPFDGVTMLLMARTPPGERNEMRREGQHPGFDGTRRRKPWEEALQPKEHNWGTYRRYEQRVG